MQYGQHVAQLPHSVRFEHSYGSDTDYDTGELKGTFIVGDIWRVAITLAPSASYAIAALTIEPAGSEPPVGGLTTRVLRALHLDAMQQSTRSEAAAGARRVTTGASGLHASPALARQLDERAKEIERGRRPGPPRINDLELARCASIYVKALGSRRPLEAVAKRTGSLSIARNRIRQARERGLLDGTKRGKQGGALTERALQLLRKVK
jgi:hypothetical protein